MIRFAQILFAFIVLSADSFASLRFVNPQDNIPEDTIFRQANAVVYLKYEQSLKIAIGRHKTTRPGFSIHSSKTNEKVGYLTTLYQPFFKRIYITSLDLNTDDTDNLIKISTLRTIQKIYKKYQTYFPKAERIVYVFSQSDTNLRSAFQKAGYTKSRYFNGLAHYGKKITGPKPEKTRTECKK